MKYAVIDIGSNSVRLLLWADGRSIYKKIETTRLGGGLSQTGRLSEAAIRRTADAVAAFAREAAREGAEKTAAFATAAVRSAENGRDFVRFVRAECGVDVDVISGEKEAALGLAGALGGRDGGIVDVGGASTEITEAAREGAEKTAAFATAAVRSAENGRDFVRFVRAECGVDVDVISGEKEAALGLAGALGGRDGGIVDVGGASTEITVAAGGKIVCAVSADIGAVRLKDLCGEDRAALARVIAEKTAAFGRVPPTAELYAIGGTATSLAALEKEVEPYDPAQIDGTVLPAECVQAWADKLLSLSQEERLRLRGMDPRRADILGGGVLLLRAAMAAAGAEKIVVSERDNMEGYLYAVCGVKP